MAAVLLILTSVLALAAMAAGAGVLLAGDRHFDRRLTVHLAPRALEADDAATLRGRFGPQLFGLLSRWGASAGKGALENERRMELRVQLIQAGYYSDRAVEAYFGLRVAATVVLAPLGLLVGMGLKLHGSLGLLGPLMAAANLGFFLPKLVLGRRIRARRDAMKLGLPDAIDLMVVAVEAGATLTAAIQRLVAEFGELHPVVAEQFGIMLTEIQAGASRAEALTRLAHRSPSEEVTSLTTMLIQSEAVGASLGGTLRVFSDELRKSRFLEAERKAAELPVKLAFPLVFCIFPCLGMVIFIPVALQAIRTLSHV